jgi:hypothetical protein
MPVEAFIIECFFYKLKNYWTLNSSTNVYIYNNCTRFQL